MKDAAQIKTALVANEGWFSALVTICSTSNFFFSSPRQPISPMSFISSRGVGLFSAQHPSHPAHDAPQRQLAALIGQEELAGLPTAVVPALQQRYVLVQFHGGSGF